MNLKEFILRLGCLGFDIVALNTYYQNDEKHCILMITQKGETGKFFKDECRIHTIDEMQDRIIKTVREWLDNGGT